MLADNRATAYIVRVWLEQREREGAPTTWRGSIEHVASGRTKYLKDLGDIVEFIQPFLEALGVRFFVRTDECDEG